MDTVTEWFDGVYSDPLYLTLYEQDDDERAEAEASSALRLLSAPAGALWLDACSGFGRHAEKLAASGLRVVGVDRSRMMVQRALARARDVQARPDYVRADLRALPFSGLFDCASLFFDSFGYFEFDVEHQDALLSLAASLKTHGKILIQLSNRERLVTALPETEVEERRGYRVTKRHRLDLVAGRMTSSLRIEGHGDGRDWALRIRLFAASELRDLCERAGFDEFRLYGDWEGSSYGPRSPQMILTARKAAFSDLPPLGS